MYGLSECLFMYGADQTCVYCFQDMYTQVLEFKTADHTRLGKYVIFCHHGISSVPRDGRRGDWLYVRRNIRI